MDATAGDNAPDDDADVDNVGGCSYASFLLWEEEIVVITFDFIFDPLLLLLWWWWNSKSSSMVGTLVNVKLLSIPDTDDPSSEKNDSVDDSASADAFEERFLLLRNGLRSRFKTLPTLDRVFEDVVETKLQLSPPSSPPRVDVDRTDPLLPWPLSSIDEREKDESNDVGVDDKLLFVGGGNGGPIKTFPFFMLRWCCCLPLELILLLPIGDGVAATTVDGVAIVVEEFASALDGDEDLFDLIGVNAKTTPRSLVFVSPPPIVVMVDLFSSFEIFKVISYS